MSFLFSSSPATAGPESKETKVVPVAALAARRQLSRPFNKGRMPKMVRPKRSKGLASMKVGDVGKIAMEAWKASKYIMSMINVEHKYFDVLSAGQLPDWNGTFYNLSNITQGADVVNRDGDSVLMTRLEVRAVIYPGGTAQQNAVRFVLFRDMEQDGVDPTVAQLIEAAALGAAGAVIAPLTYFYAGHGTTRKRRFEILADRTISCAIRGGSGTVEYFDYVHEFRGGDKHILYDATAGADASNREGMLGMIIISDNSGAGNVPNVTFYSRIIFTDD